MVASNTDSNSFAEFNQSRELLAQQFHNLIEIVGNHVFQGNINLENTNMLEEINSQEKLMGPEKNVLRNLHFYSSNLVDSRFLLGILGRFKAGKSTALNALSGENISPMDTRISTGVLNFTYKNDKEKCIVVYDSGREMEIDPQEKSKYVDFRHNPDNEQGIHSVRHGSPNLDLQKEIVFVDTPGLEAVNSIHEKITLDFVAQCHAAVVISGYPPFGEGELRFYEHIKEVIPNIFLLQNLPEDKLDSWIALEAQTLENLNKLGFYQLERDIYPDEDAPAILRKIGDRQDEAALTKFKQVHKINLYSANALAAYKFFTGESSEQQSVQNSRFPIFKDELYAFLANNKGQKLIEQYLIKGKVVLDDLLRMVTARRDILKDSVEDIERQIQEQEKRQQQTNATIEMVVDRTKLKMIEAYKNLKARIMEQDLQQVLQELNQTYGEQNIFRLRKEQLKKIKLQITEFNRLFSIRHQELVQEIQNILAEGRENIIQVLENQSILQDLEIKSTCPTLSIGDIAGAGYIEAGFEAAYRLGLAYILGSLAGGEGIAVVSMVLDMVGFGTRTAAFTGAVIGAVVGLGLSFPLEKYVTPFLDTCKNLLSKLINKPTKTVFEDFKAEVRAKLDEVENAVIDKMIANFRSEVTQNAREFIEMFTKTLEDLKYKKTHGMEQQELQKLQEIVDQLQTFRQQFEHFGRKDVAIEDSKVQNVLRGLKGFVKKFKTEE